MRFRGRGRTTKTGTVTLSFLPEGGNLIWIQKIGFNPVMMTIAISPSDTVPLTIVMSSSSQTLPTVVTTDSTPKYCLRASRIRGETTERHRTLHRRG